MRESDIVDELLQDFSSTYKIKGVATAVLQNDDLHFHSTGNFQNNTIITHETIIPLGNLMDILISSYVVRNQSRLGYNLETPISKIIPQLKIIEKKMSFHFLQLNHLLSHGSGLSPIRTRKDYYLGTRVHKTTDVEKIIPLKSYFTYPLLELQAPGDIFVKNDMNFGLIARILELKEKRSFNEIITEFLQQYDQSIRPFDLKFEPGYVQNSSKRRKQKKQLLHFYHLYPSKMGSMSIIQYLRILQSILFEENNQELFDHHLKTIKSGDDIGIPLRYRTDLGLYQLTTVSHGYTINLIINRESKSIFLTVINLEAPDSIYLTGKIMRKLVSTYNPQPIPSYSFNPLQLSNKQKEAVFDRYVSFDLNIYSSLYNDEMGGGIQIMEDKTGIYMTNIPDGIFLNSTRVSRKHHLHLISMEDGHTVCGYDDGLYYSKIIIPDVSKAASIFIELDQGPCLHFKSYRKSMIFSNIRENLNYYLHFGIIPLFNQVFSPQKTTVSSIVSHKNVISVKKPMEIGIHQIEGVSHLTDLAIGETELISSKGKQYDKDLLGILQETEQTETIKRKKKKIQWKKLVIFTFSLPSIIFNSSRAFILGMYIFFKPFVRRAIYDISVIINKMKIRIYKFGVPTQPEMRDLRQVSGYRFKELQVSIDRYLWLRVPQIASKYGIRKIILNFRNRMKLIKRYNEHHRGKITLDKQGLLLLGKFSWYQISRVIKSIQLKYPKMNSYMQYIHKYIRYKFAISNFNRIGIQEDKPNKSMIIGYHP